MHNNDPNYGREFLGGHELASYDRMKDMKVFDDTKAGVKGVVDHAGALSKIPRIFVRPDDELAEEEEFRVLKNCVNSENSSKFETPVIDLEGVAWMDKNDVGYEQRREEVVKEIRHASETSGFFQLINHGIPKNVMDEMVKGVKRFHEQDDEAKKPMYSRDPNKSTVYFDNHFHYHKARFTEWKDSLVCRMLSPDPINPKDLPETFRDIMLEYTEHVINLGDTLVELLSEGLGLALECTKNLDHICDYYPACPEPQLTLGSGKHSDSTFFTVLLQDDIGGLQFLHQKFWIDVKQVHGSLLVNIGDLLQVISNERFKSAEHRVVANLVGPRISMASFFSGSKTYRKLCGPIKEVVQ